MGQVRGAAGSSRREGRRWRFASAEFDEERWALIVDGRPVPMETKPLELLRELLLRAGKTVSKDELLDAVWPGIAVVEASLTTAVLKLRRALGDDDRDSRIIETVSRIGYRMGVPVELVADPVTSEAKAPSSGHMTPGRTGWTRLRALNWPIFASSAAVVIATATLFLTETGHTPAVNAAQPITQRYASDALRRLDLKTIDGMLRAGWDPNKPLDKEGSVALGKVAEICEWDPDHDRQKMLLVARALFDSGARLDVHNIWGDTPYSIAKAKRYCGPDHPVTKLMHAMCYTSSPDPLGDKCLATYELKREDER
jgi:DNA-binding winged helix-turn-helix (wHTH) protein